MQDAAAWIEHYRQFWEAQLDSLARYLEDSANEEVRSKHGKQSAKRHRRRF
jgi:hypothetical protein